MYVAQISRHLILYPNEILQQSLIIIQYNFFSAIQSICCGNPDTHSTSTSPVELHLHCFSCIFLICPRTVFAC